jgi:S-DNA-T family DNA segregation ATPase FtsK/SpoIIIE
MPHLLIAGSTGSGKTVCINAILASFLFHASPEELRLILVDPKIVEMQIYNRLPHMLLPTLTDPKKVPNALRWLIHNMEWRYHLFASVGVRNIAGFNAKVVRTREENEKAKDLDRQLSPEERAAMATIKPVRHEAAPTPDRKLPYIVCVIDELADLMLVAPDDVENSVTRLAQLARAAGIHLILATQRPSVNVITGVIKANLPSRIAFKVASKVDSRTILDANGADGLLGHGDMLFLPPGETNLVRAQGAWVSDEEINRIVDFLAKNGPPRFDRQAMAFVEDPNSGDDG